MQGIEEMLCAAVLLGVILFIILMAKLSELNGRLVSVEKKVDTLLLGTTPADPDLPADAEETLVRLETKLAAVTPQP